MSQSAFQRIGRPVLTTIASGCYIVSLNNFYWEYKVKNQYQHWFDKQQQYLTLIKQIDPELSTSSSLIEAPFVGFNTPTQKLYKLGVHLQSHGDQYETHNELIYQKVKDRLTSSSTSAAGDKSTDNQKEEKKESSHGLVVSIPELLQQLSEKHEAEKSSREEFLTVVNAPTFLLVDSETNRYRYKTLSLVKVGAVAHLLSMGGKYAPILSIAVAVTLISDLHQHLTEEEAEKEAKKAKEEDNKAIPSTSSAPPSGVSTVSESSTSTPEKKAQ